jgi:hypothetical protein
VTASAATLAHPVPSLGTAAARCVSAAFSGDPAAAAALVAAVPAADCGAVVRAFSDARLWGDGFRSALRAAWERDPASVVAAAGGPRRVLTWFRQAIFALPPLPPILPLWRGAFGHEVAAALAGLTWTTRRDVACWYACRDPRRRPLVVRRWVKSRAILFMSDTRGEAEVIVSPPLAADYAGEIDAGGPAEWRAVAAAYSRSAAATAAP